MSRHPVDPFSFVCGLLVLAAGLILLTGNLDQVPLEWVGPAVAIGLGVVIAAAAYSGRPSREPAPDPDEG